MKNIVRGDREAGTQETVPLGCVLKGKSMKTKNNIWSIKKILGLFIAGMAIPNFFLVLSIHLADNRLESCSMAAYFLWYLSLFLGVILNGVLAVKSYSKTKKIFLPWLIFIILSVLSFVFWYYCFLLGIDGIIPSLDDYGILAYFLINMGVMLINFIVFLVVSLFQK